MVIEKIIRAVYVLFAALLLIIGAGALRIPTGWLPAQWQLEFDVIYAAEAPTSYLNHLTQEFGTVVIALGMVFLWQARRADLSRTFHWMMTFYLALDTLIHWVGPQGLIGDLQRGIVNSIPTLLMLGLGLWWGRSGAVTAPAAR